MTYLDAAERRVGLEADLFVGHLWNYLPVSSMGRFLRRIAFYAVSDPNRRRALLHSRGRSDGVAFRGDALRVRADHDARIRIDDRVLQHAVIVEPLDVVGQRAAMLDALTWPEEKYRARQETMLRALHECHNWSVFDRGVQSALVEIL